MKKNMMLAWGALGLGALITFGQPVGAAPGDAGAPKAGKGAKRAGLLPRLRQELELTPEQVEKIKPLVMAAQKEMKALRGDTNLLPEQKKAKRQEITAKLHQDIAPFLTEAQKAKLAAMKDGPQGGRGKGKGKKAKPAA